MLQSLQDNKWYKIDDSKVTEEKNIELTLKRNNSGSYILFYKKL